MSLLDSLRVAFDALTAHLLRTVLAMLGLSGLTLIGSSLQ